MVTGRLALRAATAPVRSARHLATVSSLGLRGLGCAAFVLAFAFRLVAALAWALARLTAAAGRLGTGSLGAALALATALAATGCYWSSPPTTPHGHAVTDPAAAPELRMTMVPGTLRSARLLVLGRFDTRAVQPIGALYDFDDYSASPLIRTYFFRHGGLELLEHACDAMRASGLHVLKDYATTGEPALLEAPLRAQSPLLVRTRVLALQHDQIRTDTDPPRDYEVVRLEVEVGVYETSGRRRYLGRHEIRGSLRYEEQADVLRHLGLKLGDRLVGDAAFRTAVEARPRGAS
jgi:hypothetical protein